MSRATQVGLFTDQSVEPPDTQVAAGPNNVVETVNDSFSIWPKAGGSPTLVLDLNNFFSVPAGQFFTDPRLMYDAESGHWFLSGWSFNATLTTTQTYLAVSETSDPTGTWFINVINASSSSELTDQPMIGVCSDKLVMAWNDFTNGSPTALFNGSLVVVLTKSDLLAGTALTGTVFSTLEFRVVPAQSLSPSNTCWATVNDADTALGGSSTSPTIGVVAFTGPAATATANETNLPITATTPPPAPAQPGGTVDAATANDDRLLSAVWQDNRLWTSGTETCTPTGDTTVRNCMRLIEVNTTTAASPSVAQDEDLGTSGVDQYYPAVSLSYTGDLFVSYTSSSSTQDPTADAVVSPSVSGTAFTTPITIKAGSAAYNGTRWGDYSAAAPDPSQPGAVWVAAEYAPSDANTGDWATGAAELTLASTPNVAVGAEGTDGQLWAQAPQLTAGWHPLGGRIIAAPAVVAAPNQDGTTAAEPLFIGTGTDETLWIRSASLDWQQIGVARCLGGAGAVITASTLTVACRGTDNALWYNTATVPSMGLPTFSGPWKSLGGVLSAGPAIAPVDGTVTFFVRGSNGQVFTRTVATGYATTPFFCTGQPAAAQGSSGETIFGCNAGGALWESVNAGAGFSPAVSLGGALIGGPGVAPTSLVPDLFAEGTDHAVWMRTPAGWSSLGGAVLGGVGAAALN